MTNSVLTTQVMLLGGAVKGKALLPLKLTVYEQLTTVKFLLNFLFHDNKRSTFIS